MHKFDEEQVCIKCGAQLQDTLIDDIGCKAKMRNPMAYIGFALTSREQAAGIRIREKVRFMSQLLDNLTPESWRQATIAWERELDRRMASRKPF